MSALLRVENLDKSFGAVVATSRLNLEVADGEIHALIGPNGAGKTTLVAQIAGAIKPDAGGIYFHGREITHLPAHTRARLGMARSFQITSLLSDFTVLDNVALAVQARSGHSFRFWRPARWEAALREEAAEFLAQTGLAHRVAEAAGNLSHGEQRQLELAVALAQRPSLLLLDEPMAGMGMQESAARLKFLQTLRGRTAMLLVEHDMDAVFALADRITVLVYGQAVATGTPAEIRADARVREAYLGSEA